jgi:hypothetical protein
LTRSTTTYHLKARTEPQPNPNSLSPPQEAARLGITPEELAAIGKESFREQTEWIAKDEAEWREREEKRWRGKVGGDRESGEEESRKRTEEATRQEQRKREASRAQTTNIMRPRSAPLPFVHLDSAAAQLGLTPEEAMEVHEVRIRAQEAIQREIEEEDRLRRQRKEHGAHPPPSEYLAYDTTDDRDTPLVLLDHHEEPGNTASATPGDDVIGQRARELEAQPGAHKDWAEDAEEEIGYKLQGEYMQCGYLTPAPPPPTWYPPQPPSWHHTRHLPPHRWYNPQEPEYTPQRAQYHPRTCPTPRRAPRFETR